MSEDNELRSLFQEKFSGDILATPEQTWDGLVGRLADLKARRRRRLIYFWLTSVGALLIGSAVVWSLWGEGGLTVENATNIGANSETETLLTVNETGAFDKTLADNEGEHVDVIESFEMDATVESENENELEIDRDSDGVENERQVTGQSNFRSANLDEKNEQNTSVNSQTDNSEVANNRPTKDDNSEYEALAISEKSHDDGRESFNNNRNDVESENHESGEPKNDTHQGTGWMGMGPQTEVVHEPGALQLTASDKSKAAKTIEKEESIAEDVPYLDLPELALIALNPIQVEPLIGIQRLNPQTSNWDIGFNYSAGRQIRRTTVENPKLTDPDFSGDSPTRQLFNAYGVRFNRSFGDHWALGFGFETSIWRYRTRNYQTKITYNTAYEFDSPVGRLPVNETEFNSLYGSTPTADTLLVTLRMFQRLRYVGIPISLQYDFGRGTVRPYVRFGMIYNFLIRQRTILYAQNSGIEREVNYRDIEGFKRFQLTLQPAFGLNWQLSDKVSLFGEGLVNLPATRFYTAPDGASQKISSQGRGANIGIRLKF